MWRLALDGVALCTLALLSAVALDGVALTLALAGEAAALGTLAARDRRRAEKADDRRGRPVAVPAAVAFLGLALAHALGAIAPPSALIAGLDPVGPAVVALASGRRRRCSDRPARRARPERLVLGGVAGAVALYLVSALVVTPFQPGGDMAGLPLDELDVRQQGQALLSAVWALIGVAGLVAGLVRDSRTLRLAALALLGLTVAKVFAFDLASLTSLYRVGSCVALGLCSSPARSPGSGSGRARSPTCGTCRARCGSVGRRRCSASRCSPPPDPRAPSRSPPRCGGRPAAGSRSCGRWGSAWSRRCCSRARSCSTAACRSAAARGSGPRACATCSTLPLLVAIVAARGGVRPVVAALRERPLAWLGWSTIGFGLFYAPLAFAVTSSPGWLLAGTWQLTILAGIVLAPLLYRDHRAVVPRSAVAAAIVVLAGVALMQAERAGAVGADVLLAGVLPVLVAAFAYPAGNRKTMEVAGGTLDTWQRILAMTVASLPFWIVLSGVGLAAHGCAARRPARPVRDRGRRRRSARDHPVLHRHRARAPPPRAVGGRRGHAVRRGGVRRRARGRDPAHRAPVAHGVGRDPADRGRDRLGVAGRGGQGRQHAPA